MMDTRPGPPAEHCRLAKLRTILSTGSPLPIDAYHWVYEAVKPGAWLASISGGTDIASCFVSCSPTLPVHAGEIQCPELGWQPMPLMKRANR